MHTARKVLAITGAGIALAVAFGVSGAGAAAADAMKPLLVRDIHEPFSIAMTANAGTTDPVRCQPVPLGSGPLVIEHVDAAFTGAVDAWLLIPATVLGGPPGGDPSLGRTHTFVRLEGLHQNLATNVGKALRFDGELRIADGMPTVPNQLFRDASDGVELCAEDDVANIGRGGPVIVSGHYLR